jgi:hypothetical protein
MCAQSFSLNGMLSLDDRLSSMLDKPDACRKVKPYFNQNKLRSGVSGKCPRARPLSLFECRAPLLKRSPSGFLAVTSMASCSVRMTLAMDVSPNSGLCRGQYVHTASLSEADGSGRWQDPSWYGRNRSCGGSGSGDAAAFSLVFLHVLPGATCF